MSGAPAQKKISRPDEEQLLLIKHFSSLYIVD